MVSKQNRIQDSFLRTSNRYTNGIETIVRDLLKVGLRDPSVPVLLQDPRCLVSGILAESVLVDNFVAISLATQSLKDRRSDPPVCS